MPSSGKTKFPTTSKQTLNSSDDQSFDTLRFLANLVEQTSDILTAADLDYKPITWNKAAEKIYGVTAKQVIGRDIRDFITINYCAATKENIREKIKKEGEWRGEAFFVRPTDNKTVTLWICFKLLKDERNNPLAHLISATDITERKEAELRLKESENRFREMADSAPVMIWMADENNKNTYLNKKWLEFTGKDISKNNAKGWVSFVHKEDITKAKEKYNEAFKNRKPITILYRLRSADGTYRWVQDVSAPRFLSDGTFVGYIGSIVDIEDQKRKEEQLHYQAIVLENVSDIIVTTDLDFKVIGWNKIAEHYYGISEADAIGKPISNLVEFTFYGTTAEQSLAELKANGIWKGEVSIVNKKGETEYFLHTVKYVYDQQNSRIGFIAMGRNITDRKKIEEQLIKSEQFYRTLIADSLDGMILVNPSGKIIFSSPSVKNVLGFEVDDIVGKTAFEFVHPDDLEWAFTSFQKEIIEAPEIKFIVVRLLKKNGDWVWCMVRGHNLIKNPYINGMVVYFHDDTLRKKANDALKESEKRFRDLIRDLQIGVVLQDKEGKTILCNDAFAEMFLATEKDLIGKGINNIALDPIHEDGRKFEAEERPTHKAIQTRQPAKDIVMGIYRPKQKDRIWLLINADPILDEHGEIMHIICSAKDISERKKMEDELLIKQISHQKQLTQASIDGQEKERREVGKELHDNIGQQLTTIKLFLDLAKTTADEATNEMVNMALKGVSEVINEVRAMSRSLVPSTLNDLGLIESINELTDSIARTMIMKIELDYFEFDEETMQENQKLTLYRIIQEQLNNIVKHAEAKNVFINLRSDEQNSYLTIKDDGNGFDLKHIRKGLGFINIKNRAELFGGKAEIISQPGKGCLLKVYFPNAIVQHA